MATNRNNPMQPQLIRELVALLGPKAVLSQAEDLMLYEYDGSVELGSPECIVFPGSTREVAEIVRLAKQYETPLVGRGAGTGLSGGAIARNGGIVISFSRMNRSLEVDAVNLRAVVQPGVVNLDLSRAVEHLGLYYAPDPSSQRSCTIGGNVSENSGGPHTLAYGVTSNHVTGMELVLPEGEIVRIGGKTIETPGYDLCGLLVGSEGTLALVTEITVRLTRKPEAVKTLLAVYDTLDETTETVVDITVRAITEVCRQHNAREVRVARDDRERDLLWKGRKNAFGALGRLSPMYYVQDGVIPRTRLPETLRCIEEVSRKYDLQIGNIFHAGDGNLHPLILFDERDPEQFKRVTAAGLEIMRHCVAVGGALTGEHGVGMEKNELMPLMFTPEDLDLMQRVRAVFNPTGRLNPGKVLPLGKACGEIRVQPLPVSSTVPA